MATAVKIFCLIDEEPLSNFFSILVPSNSVVADLKRDIKSVTLNNRRLRDVDANQLELWRVSIPCCDETDGDGDTNMNTHINLDDVKDRKKLNTNNNLSKVFNGGCPENEEVVIRIIVRGGGNE